MDLGKRYNLSNTQVMMNEGFAQNYGKLNPKYNYQIGYERKVTGMIKIVFIHFLII